MARTSVSSENWLARLGSLIFRAAGRYNETDGEQRAASFAYYAFFSLFPLIILLVTTVGGSLLKDERQATTVVTNLLEQYVPLSQPDQQMIAKTINGVIKTRGSAGIMAVLTLAWSSLRFFQALVRGINRAYGTREYAWWRLPLKNLGMIGILASALVLASLLPTVLKIIRGFLPLPMSFVPEIFQIALQAVPLLILWYALTLFYKYAPHHTVSFSHVWPPALAVTFLLKLVQYLFGIYVLHYSNFNLIYGTFAGVMALLLWIYLSGSLIIYGGCLCAIIEENGAAAKPRKTRKRQTGNRV